MPRSMRLPLTVAVAQPVCRSHDIEANARAHGETIRRAEAQLVVFPELSLTGYALDAELVEPSDDRLTPVVQACAAIDSLALVGAPVGGGIGGGEGAGPHIAVLAVDASGARVVYRKCHLGGDEPGRFRVGAGPATVELEGWRIGLGVCKDTGSPTHIRETAALDVDLYAAGLVHGPEELEEQDRPGAAIARAAGAHVAFASFAGPTGGGFDRTAATSTIWSSDGRVVARAGREPGELARAILT